MTDRLTFEGSARPCRWRTFPGAGEAMPRHGTVS